MTQSAPLLTPPAPPDSDGESGACHTDTRFTAQTREERHLVERVQCALAAAGYGPLRGLDITAHVRLVTLEGRVPSYYLKQRAQVAVLAVSGVDRVRNELVVGRPV